MTEEDHVSATSDIDVTEAPAEFREVGGSLADELVRDEMEIIRFGSALSRLKRTGFATGDYGNAVERVYGKKRYFGILKQAGFDQTTKTLQKHKWIANRYSPAERKRYRKFPYEMFVECAAYDREPRRFLMDEILRLSLTVPQVRKIKRECDAPRGLASECDLKRAINAVIQFPSGSTSAHALNRPAAEPPSFDVNKPPHSAEDPRRSKRPETVRLTITLRPKQAARLQKLARRRPITGANSFALQ